MSHRLKLSSHKHPKQDHELHIITNPLFENRLRHHHQDDDYQAPLTSHTLLKTSKWTIVRNNIHKIRSWGGISTSNVAKQHIDWYMLVHTRRELRRTKDQIRQIEQSNFVPIHRFRLPTDELRYRQYNVSHLQSSDKLYHPSFGTEPVIIQSLLYYFSKECAVPYTSLFRPFLVDVCEIIEHDRERLKRAAVFRKVALAIAIIICIILALMYCSLIISVLTTTLNLRDMYKYDPDGGSEWRESKTILEENVNFF
ncbi:hypothetical protein I4U23_029461 [Adineta vaga]|nr:hypothetical protein I4U23_029461 [Adineta vaga]